MLQIRNGILDNRGTQMTAECNCLDGAYDSCDVCSPPMEKGWFEKQVKKAKADMKLIGGSVEPHSIYSHARKQQNKILRLQKEIRNLKRELDNANQRKNNTR